MTNGQPCVEFGLLRSARIVLDALIARYGLAAVLLGSGFEGEAVVLSAGLLAHKGLLPFWGVAACAALGAAMVDQLWFLAGRLARDRPFVQRLRNKPSYQRALRPLHRYPIGFVFSFRFVYGLRTVSPVVIGTSDLPAWQFVTLNGLAAVLWGPLLTWAGFQFGKALGPLLTDARSLMIASLFGLLSAALGYVAMRRLLARRRSKA